MTEAYSLSLQYKLALLCILAFFVSFLPRRFSRATTITIAVVSFMICTTISDIGYFIYGRDTIQEQITGGITVFIIQATAYVMSKYRDFRILFKGATSGVIVQMASMFFPIATRFGMRIWLAFFLQFLLYLLIWSILTYAISQDFMIHMNEKDIPWMPLCVIPGLFYLASRLVTWDLHKEDMYHVWLHTSILICLLIILMACYVIMVKLYVTVHQNEELKASMEYISVYADRLKREADYIQEKEQAAAIMRHDMKHYVRLLSGFLDEGNIDAVREALVKIDGEMVAITPDKYCENLAVNNIIQYFKKVASEKKIRFDVTAVLPQKISIEEFELATVISNLLENATRAASEMKGENRYVGLNLQLVKQQILLEVVNSYEGKVSISEDTGLPESNRGEGHGYGMQSIQAFIQKYSVMADYSSEGNKFYVRMLINI